MSADETVKSACGSPSSHRVITDLEPVAGHWDCCSVCFSDTEPNAALDADGELCVSSTERKLHRTRRQAGTLSHDQGDYSGYDQPTSTLNSMEIEEFEQHLEDEFGGRSA